MLKSSELYASLELHKGRRWLITGVAGFIGSNLLIKLLSHGQTVVGLDSFITGHQYNLDRVHEAVGDLAWENFTFIKGDIRNVDVCMEACDNVDYVLHQAALGSVPRSIENPLDSNDINISGFLTMLNCAKEQGVKSFTYASSSSVYGDIKDSPKVEARTGSVLSPYAATKAVNELYADVFSKNYKFHAVGLRYFNVFGAGQDPNGAYAAVIPKWVSAMLAGDDVFINGDGSTSRDFCYIENVIEANIRAALSSFEINQVFNVALGGSTTLSELFEMIRLELGNIGCEYNKKPIFRDFRKGDVKHSLANIENITDELGYQGEYSLSSGLALTMPWYARVLGS